MSVVADRFGMTGESESGEISRLYKKREVLSLPSVTRIFSKTTVSPWFFILDNHRMSSAIRVIWFFWNAVLFRRRLRLSVHNLWSRRRHKNSESFESSMIALEYVKSHITFSCIGIPIFTAFTSRFGFVTKSWLNRPRCLTRKMSNPFRLSTFQSPNGKQLS